MPSGSSLEIWSPLKTADHQYADYNVITNDKVKYDDNDDDASDDDDKKLDEEDVYLIEPRSRMDVNTMQKFCSESELLA